MLERRRVTALRERRKGEGKARWGEGGMTRKERGEAEGCWVWWKVAVPPAHAWSPLQKGHRPAPGPQGANVRK